MKFFKPTRAKVIITVLLAIWPYVVSFIYVNRVGEGNVFSDSMVRFAFVYHAWEWSPLFVFLQHTSKHMLIEFWRSELFIFFIYPLLRFISRYILVCIIAYFIKVFSKHSHKHPHERV